MPLTQQLRKMVGQDVKQWSAVVLMNGGPTVKRIQPSVHLQEQE
tara:strand:- start:389 stop:520 length:132 start_codon:yes stop_codon:yes gene_type:complete